MRPRRTLPPLALATSLAAAGCARGVGGALPDADAHAVQRAALVALFVDRERGGALDVWTDAGPGAPRAGARRDALTLGALPGAGAPDDTLALDAPDVAALALPVPARAVTPAALAAHFARHPDAWEAWFRQHPGSGGVVELTVPRRAARDSAWVVVGRACGEHCRQAWRVTLGRAEGDVSAACRVARIEALRLPRS